MSDEGRGKTALVTGASSGIGKAFAELLAAKGYAVVLTARRSDRLEALAAELRQRHGVSTHTIVADLAQPDASQHIAAELASRGLMIDVLVNNAGYGVPGSYVNVPWGDHARFMQVMVTAVLDLTYRLLPGMLDRGWGRIINIASVAGMVPSPAGPHALRRVEILPDPLFRSAGIGKRAERRQCHRGLPWLYVERVSRCDRDARQDEERAGFAVAQGR